MPKPNPKPKNSINKKALTDLARTPSASKRPQKPDYKPVHSSGLRQSQVSELESIGTSSDEGEQSGSTKAPNLNSKDGRSSKVDSTTEEESDQSSSSASTIRQNVGNGTPAYGSPLPDGELDPFPRPVKAFRDTKLYNWFEGNGFEKSVIEERKEFPWETVDLAAQKKAFIHADRRVMTALRENHILRIQGNMDGADSGISLRAFADADILKAEKDDAIFEFEDWDSMVNDQDLGKKFSRQTMQNTIVAMAKIYRRIQTQNDILAEETAQWHLMCAWIDDAQARLAYESLNEQPQELHNLRLGARVLLEGACKIEDDLWQCVQSFEAMKAEAMKLEKTTKQKYGPLIFQHLMEREAAKRPKNPSFRFDWENYDVKEMFYEQSQTTLRIFGVRLNNWCAEISWIWLMREGVANM